MEADAGNAYNRRYDKRGYEDKGKDLGGGMKKEFNADRDSIIEEAIPSAIRVKEEILTFRNSAIQSLGELVFRKRKGLSTGNALNEFQANVIALYQILRCYYKKDSGFRKEMDKVVKIGEKMPFSKLYNAFCLLDDKIYDLRITKIEIRKMDDENIL